MTGIRELKKTLNEEYKDDDFCMTSGKQLKEYKVTELKYKNLLRELEQFKNRKESQVQGLRTKREEDIARLQAQIKKLKATNELLRNDIGQLKEKEWQYV